MIPRATKPLLAAVSFGNELVVRGKWVQIREEAGGWLVEYGDVLSDGTSERAIASVIFTLTTAVDGVTEIVSTRHVHA